MKKIIMMLAIITALSACAGGPAPGTTEIKASKVSFSSENGSLTINNQASFDVIIFAGRVENGNVIGGIKAGASRSFNLSKINNIPQKGSLLIRAASFETFNRKNFRVTEEDVIHTGLVVYDLTNPGDKWNMNIYKGMDQTQSTFIYVSNTSPNFVLELRLEHPNGEKIVTLPPLLEQKKVWISPKDDGLPYRFYATYVYVDPQTLEINSMIATDKSDSLREVPRNKGDPIAPLVFNGPNTSTIGYNVGFVQLKNDTGEGLIFQDGATLLADQKGMRFTQSGQRGTYELSSESGAEGQVYTNLSFDHDRGAVTRLGKVVIRPGYVYDLTVTNANGIFQYDVREVGMRSKLNDARIQLFLE
ncbi:hypothetical protein AGMMS49546_29160 [Spirochaetia bacterium]|nr:hypothetical protein AGMMS49546_29160 [Spirochaetia bacterium]